MDYQGIGFAMVSIVTLYGVYNRAKNRRNGGGGMERLSKFQVSETDKNYKRDSVVFADKQIFEEKLARICKDGPDNLRLIVDFDYTLTTFWCEGDRGYSCHKIVEDCSLLSETFRDKAYALQEHYFPLEVSAEITKEEKYHYMVEWVERTHNALVEAGFQRSYLKQAVREAKCKFRDGVDRFLNTMDRLRIPVLIFSAGIADVLEEKLSQSDLFGHANVKIASNRMVFSEDSTEKLIGFEAEMAGREAFHVMNKNFAHISPELKEDIHSHWERSGIRHNTILIGDSIGDVNMSEGLPHECEIKIGFLNHHIQERLEEYLKHYDAVILNDGTFSFINRQVIDRIIAIKNE